MTKSGIKELLTKFLESIPDDVETVENTVETETAGETETVETVENTVETNSAGGNENTESVESTEEVETTGETETTGEEKRIYVTESGDYDYR